MDQQATCPGCGRELTGVIETTTAVAQRESSDCNWTMCAGCNAVTCKSCARDQTKYCGDKCGIVDPGRTALTLVAKRNT